MNVSVSPYATSNYSFGSVFALEGEDNQSSRADLLPRIAVKTASALIPMAVISKNNFFRTCLARCLAQMATEFEISSYDSPADWLEHGGSVSSGVVLLCGDGQKATESLVQNDLDLILRLASDARVIVVSDFDHPALLLGALQKGARGFVPTTLDLDVVLGAIKLVNVGGTFIPASGLMSMHSQSTSNAEARGAATTRGPFTGRQLEVLEYLRVGDPNKIIAYKMNMSEATVKIHVSNMMRKIKAHNRTELVCKSNELLDLH
jgi:DNA-binding NarL/FixJ family response regulator